MRERYAREREAITRNLEVQKEALNTLAPVIVQASGMIEASLERGGKVLVFGNGGSAASAQHFAAELTGRYVKEREPKAAVALTTDTSVITAVGNDYGFDEIFARQVRALAKKSDVAVGFSTSGNSQNVIKAFEAAREIGCATVAILGRDGGTTVEKADTAIVYKAQETPRIQEFHGFSSGHDTLSTSKGCWFSWLLPDCNIDMNSSSLERGPRQWSSSP